MEATDLDGYDDVASLFHRLGSKDESIAYKDFSASHKPVVAKAAVRETAVASPVTAASAPLAVNSAAAAVLPTEVSTLSVPGVVERQATPLQQMFQRLAGCPVRSSGRGPLSKLQIR